MSRRAKASTAGLVVATVFLAVLVALGGSWTALIGFVLAITTSLLIGLLIGLQVGRSQMAGRSGTRREVARLRAELASHQRDLAALRRQAARHRGDAETYLEQLQYRCGEDCDV